MADLTKTITNSINCFGPAPSSKWGTGAVYNFTWGSSKWGEGTIDLPINAGKAWGETVTIDDSDVALSIGYFRTRTYTLASTFECGPEYLRTANGYYYSFTFPTLDADGRNQSTYSEVTAGAASFTSQATPSTDWS